MAPGGARHAARDDVDACAGKGVYNPSLEACRCTAGWGGRWCELREPRPCNRALGGGRLGFPYSALCSGDCDEDRGACYCAGLAPKQRPLPHMCQPAVHISTKLPDGRPAIPALSSDGEWRMSDLYFDEGEW